MELGLKMEEISCCATVGNLVVSHEESLETSIPEYCPDIARIVDTAGQLRIREKSLTEGCLRISGDVRVTVLYTSEEGPGLRSLVLTVPFSCRTEEPRLQGCRNVSVWGRLPLLEAKSLTSRKLYIRVIPEFIVEGIRCARQTLCCGAEDNDAALQMRSESAQLTLLTSVLEREFNFSQECVPDGDVPEDLLLDRCCLQVTDCQRIGRKLIVKGEAHLSALYRTQAQSLCTYDTVLPFSQILDGMDLPEDAVYRSDVWTADSHIRLTRTDGSVGFGVSLRIGVMVKIYELRTVTYLCDLYSTRYETDVHRQAMVLTAADPAESTVQEADEQLEFGREVPFVCLTGTECSAVSEEPDGEHKVLRTNLRLKILYLDESGAPVSAERTAEVTAQITDASGIVRAVCGNGTVHMAGNSCQVHVPVVFTVEREKPWEISGMTAVEMTEPEEGPHPSVILRRVGAQETLWDVAKAYRTDPALILQANDLKEEPLPEGMILIPKMR